MTNAERELRERVEAALRDLEDPRLGMNVFEAGLVEDIRIDDASVVVEADLAQFDPGSADDVLRTMLAVVDDVEGVESAHVEQAAADTKGRVSIADVDTVIAVASTKGGVGKTTVAVNLACALAADGPVGLFDADIYGPNAPSLLGVEGPIRADEDDRPVPRSVGPLEVMSVASMTDGGPLAWRGAMAHDALTDLFADTAWDDPETVVVDLPPGTGDVPLTTLQEVRVDGVVFVTTPFHTSVEDTRRSLQLFEENGVPVLGVVVNMDRFTCPSCGDVHDLFPGDDPAADLDVPVLARLPFSTDLQSGPRPGEVPEALASLAASVEGALAERTRLEVPEDALDIRGLPPEARRQAVREAWDALESGETLSVVSDRDPTPAGAFLVELCDAEGDPSQVLPRFAVDRRGPEEWALVAERP